MRLTRLNAVSEGTGLRRSTIYKYIAKGPSRRLFR